MQYLPLRIRNAKAFQTSCVVLIRSCHYLNDLAYLNCKVTACHKIQNERNQNRGKTSSKAVKNNLERLVKNVEDLTSQQVSRNVLRS